MRKIWKNFCLTAVIVSLALFAGSIKAPAQTHEFKISLDTVPNHPRNMGLEIFVPELAKRSGGKLVAKVYHSGQLYKDAHVAKAIRTGTVEMCIPGNWVLEGIDTSTSITMLPMFFGQPGKVTEDLVDGEVGKAVNRSLEKKLTVKALGRWYELGYDQTWTLKKKITKLEDFKGLKMRHSGGSLPAERFKAFGASPVFIAWPDVPMALAQGTVDGLASTTKSVESAKLHESGLKYGVSTKNFQGYYIPLVSQKFWNSLSPNLQKIFMDTWNELVSQQREIARREQKMAKDFLQSKGVEFYDPSDEELTKWRKQLLPIQEGLIKELKHDPEMIKMAKKALGM
jgi:TRAP-type transport system periplasmic protein